jgi:hypothetical protein
LSVEEADVGAPPARRKIDVLRVPAGIAFSGGDIARDNSKFFCCFLFRQNFFHISQKQAS